MMRPPPEDAIPDGIETQFPPVPDHPHRLAKFILDCLANSFNLELVRSDITPDQTTHRSVTHNFHLQHVDHLSVYADIKFVFRSRQLEIDLREAHALEDGGFLLGDKELFILPYTSDEALDRFFFRIERLVTGSIDSPYEELGTEESAIPMPPPRKSRRKRYRYH